LLLVCFPSLLDYRKAAEHSSQYIMSIIILSASLSRLFIIVFCAALFTYFLLLLILPYLRHYLPDNPNVRSSHTQLKPRGGGVAFVAVSVLSSTLALLLPLFVAYDFPKLVLLPLVALPLSIVCFFDDRYQLPIVCRFVVQLLTALILVFFAPLPISLGFFPLLLFAIVSIINFTNFMDGLDGLVAGCCVISFSFIALHHSDPWPIWVLVGSLLGFLRLNWCPAKVFMGDVGSIFLGTVFAGLVLLSPCLSISLASVLVATPLLADSCFCLIRRLIARQNIFHPHSLHLYQRLYQAGWSHSMVASIYITATFALAVAFSLGGFLAVLIVLFLVLFAGYWLDRNVAFPFHT